MVTDAPSGGTGSSLGRAVVIGTGVSSLVASLLSVVSIWLQAKNYRKPLLQRYVVRILLMVPIYAVSSWTSIVSLRAAQFLDPIRDVYEAFTIYTFFQLLINFLGGERNLIIMTHGRPPVQHAWPLNRFLPKVDISDPHTFLAVKLGVLQYAWLKPILGLASIIMKATGTYKEGYLGVTSGYLWSGIVYNISVTLSLYSLAMFWVCLHDDLVPYRPVPKFLCVKLIIFASYWQGFFLSILQWLGALSNGVAGYTPDNAAAAIQDGLICFEMPIFAIAHWYGFSWHDYANAGISAARMPVKYALRDAFGCRDLIEDTKMTLRGGSYEYRLFDSVHHVIPHAESNSRVKRVMDGMRYERGGKAKYWIPRPGEINSRTPLLAGTDSGRYDRSQRRGSALERFRPYTDIEETTLDEEDEGLFANARALEFGDWNYPVITANKVPWDQRLAPTRSYQSPRIAEPVRKSRKYKKRRQDGSEDIRQSDNSSTTSARSRDSGNPNSLRHATRATPSGSPHKSQFADLAVRDREAEAHQRAQTRREVDLERRHFHVPNSTTANEGEDKAISNPRTPSGKPVESLQDLGQEKHIGVPSPDNAESSHRNEEDEDPSPRAPPWDYGALDEGNVWKIDA